MSNDSYISLIDLSKHLPFEIDEKLKEELCFGETLIISCGHYIGDIAEGSSESDWTCHESTESEVSEEVLEEPVVQKLPEVEESKPVEEEKDNEFHFFFFPDCTKSPPEQNSQASFIMVDGLPQLNTGKKMPDICTCHTDAKGECECHTKLPCRCGAKTKAECTCGKLKEVCICGALPRPVCKCRGSEVCVCAHGDKVMPVCTCDQVDKPCICHPGKFPKPVCVCTSKPKFYNGSEFSEPSYFGLEEEQEKPIIAGETEKVPCECQKPDPKPRCFCLKGKDCNCKENQCVCEAQKPCVCESVESVHPPCKDDEIKSICDCTEPIKECTCEAESPTDCKCLPKLCTCGDPRNCKCSKICDCSDPCICETTVQKTECDCVDTTIPPCTCHDSPKSRKLKKVRAGKHGYRWCHEVDPHHTYFDYAYGRHDKVSYKEQEREKLKILGLYDEKLDDKVSDTQEIKAPAFVKKVRKPCIDCCSSVGGISFSVETLGEDKDKFLVQVVSHASKEGAKTGSKLVSILDCNLHTMEENRTEHITKGTLTKERRSYMAICESGYYNKVTRICGDKDVVKRFYHSFEKAHNFLLEGANIVFLRYIGLRRFRGNLQTDTVLMDGTICQSIYVSHGVSQAIVNGKPLFVIKVERHITEPSGVCHQTLTVLTLRGYIVSHEWADSSYLFHINPLLKIVPEKDEIEEHSPLRERWREDLQLLSDYLDYKSARSSEGARYVMESGALTGAVRDYLQAILLLRPQDTLHFTRHYFGSVLSALDIPHDEYFDPTSKHVRYYFFEE